MDSYFRTPGHSSTMILTDNKNYQIEVPLKASPTNVFVALTKQLELWWGKVDQNISKEEDEFTIYFGKAFWRFRVIKFVPNRKMVWECIDGQPSFESEWIGTTLHWELEYDPENEITSLHFLHNGLTPDFECFDICAPTWTMFLNTSLKRFLETGEGNPH